MCVCAVTSTHIPPQHAFFPIFVRGTNMLQALSSWGIVQPAPDTAPRSTPRTGRSSFLTVTTNDGVSLAYEVFGEEKEGPVILLIHGMYKLQDACVVITLLKYVCLLSQDGLVHAIIGTAMHG